MLMYRLYRAIMLVAFLLLVGEEVNANAIALVKSEAPASIPYSQSQTFQFGTVPQAKSTVLLKIKSRMDTPTLGGSLFFMKIMLNGHEITAARSRSQIRLVNKPVISPVTPNLSHSWYQSGPGWNVIYAPDFEAAYKENYYVGDPYLYVFDVTDLTNPISTNRLEISNTATAAFVARTSKHAGRETNKLDMVIGELEIEVKAEPSLMMLPIAGAQNIINPGKPATGSAKYQGRVLDGGGIAIAVGNKTYQIHSRFSYPNAGFNSLSAGVVERNGQKEWQVTRKRNIVQAKGRDYAIRRTVNFQPHRIEVSDAITNLHSNRPIGLSVRNELNMSQFENAPVRLAGNTDPTRNNYHSFGNPSVHVVVEEGALGLLAEDDVFRRQIRLYTQEKTAVHNPVAGIRTDMLRIAPASTYTLKWAIYPVAGQDYFDFVNLVRTDWKANYTTEGTWVWGFHEINELSAEEVRRRIKRQKITTFIAPDWVEWQPNARGTQRIGFGTDVLSDYWKERHESNKKAMAKLRQAAPDIKILGYIDAMRETADDTQTRFSDSLRRDASGKPFIDQWQNIGNINQSYGMVPTIDNRFGKAIMETARRYMDELGLDGIYWDEAEAIQFNEILLTEQGNFDGHSALLNPQTWEIEKEVGIIPLASHSFLNQVVSVIQKKGGAVLMNGPTGTQDILKKKVQRMTEVQHNDIYASEGHLQTPLGYMSWQDSWDNYLRVLKLGILPNIGFRSDLPHDILGHLFPFTPLEIYAGYFLGQERIVATHSGNYGWKNENVLARVLHFDANGKKQPGAWTTRISGEARTQVILKENEAVVLERLPMSFMPTKGEAEISGMSYEGDFVSLKLSAPQGGVLNLREGEFVLEVNSSVTVQIGNATPYRLKIINQAVQVPIEAGFSGLIRIQK